MHDRVRVAVVFLLALSVPSSAQAPDLQPQLDQLVSGMSPTMQFILNGIVLAVAVGAGLVGYFRKGRAAAPSSRPSTDIAAQVVGGALADRQSMQALAESNHALTTAVRALTAVLEKMADHAAENEADEELKKRIDDMVEERLRALESPAPTRRPPR